MKNLRLGLWFALCCSLTAAAATLPPQKLLPNNTLVVVTMPDCASGWSFVTNSSLSRLWHDPAMKDFTDKFTGQFKTALVGPLEQTLGIHFADYQGLARGQMTFAVIPVDHQGDAAKEHAGNLGMVFLLDSADHASQLTTNLAALKKKWIDAGKTVKSDKIRDVDFDTFITSSDDLSPQKLLPNLFGTNDSSDQSKVTMTTPEGGNLTIDAAKTPPDKVELTVGQSGSLLIVSQSRDVIEKILARQSGGLIPALDEQPDFQNDYAARLHDTPLYAWFNVKALLNTLSKPSAGDSGDSVSSAPMAALSSLGLTGLTSTSVAYSANSDGMTVKVFVGAPEANRKGLLKVLATEAKISGPPAFVPGDVVKFSRIRMDIPNNWKALEATLNQISPQYAQLLNYVFSLAGKDKDDKYDLRAELLASLGDDIISYGRKPASTSLGDLKDPPGIYLIGSPDPEKLAAALKVAASVASTPDGVKDREFLGRKIYSVTTPMSPQGGSHAYSFAASGGYVAITSDVQMLEEYLRSGGDSQAPGLNQKAGLTEAAQKVGGLESGIFSYTNDKENMRAIVETLRKEQPSWTDISGLAGASQIPGTKISTVEDATQFKKWADFSLLPPADAILKYFDFSVWTGGFTPDGFSMQGFSPTPASLR
jgi:hypothetical protein